MSLEDLKDKRILIYGYAREGESTLKFLKKHFGDIVIGIADEKKLTEMTSEFQTLIKSDKNLRFHPGISSLNSLNTQYDIIIKSPGIPIKRVPIKLLPMVTDQTELFLTGRSKAVIGITGTKGKSTTASLIFEILKKAGKKTILLGNIGRPPLDYFDADAEKDIIFVFEMSSHQLVNVSKSPHIAVLLNIFPEHLDYYKSYKDYIDAKANITKFQNRSDFFVFNDDDVLVSKIARVSPAQKVPFSQKDLRALPFIPKIKLQGEMNKLNILAAYKVSRILEIPEEVFTQAASEFNPLEHRLEKVGEFRGLTFYNDSLATIPEATIAALNTLGDRVETLFIGGYDRGVPVSKLAQRILESKISNLVLFPTTGEKIWTEIIRLDPGATKRFKNVSVENMESAVRWSYENTTPGKIVLLSCAATSFNLFKDYRDRGNQFKEWAVRLGNS